MPTLLNRATSYFSIINIIILFLIPAIACSQDEYSTFSLQFENDALLNTDSQYSNGMYFTYITPLASSPSSAEINHNPPLLRLHNFFHENKAENQKSISFSFGQNIYTPDNTESPDLIEDDRPYAGISYFSIGLHEQKIYTMSTFEIDMGMVGYHSYAEKTQQYFHDLLAWDQPRGWKHQLDDEFFLGLTYERRWKLTNEGGETGFGFELIPSLGGSFGNAFINCHTGAELRLGWNLPGDYGTARIRQGALATINPGKMDKTFSTRFSRIGFHLFCSVDGEAVIRNILLDGNTFTDSHSVDKKSFVLTNMIGISFLISRYKLTLAHVFKTRQFDSQENDLQYGSISFSFSF